MKIKISLITIKDRYRADFGDIDALADSIDNIGLLHPPIIDSNYTLIDGERRIRATEKLGLDEIEARIVHVPSLLLAEHDANAFAKQWTVSEKVAIGKAIEAELISQRKGNNQHTQKEDVQNFAQAKSSEIAAEKAGFNNKETYRQAKKAVDAAIPEIIEKMDQGEVSVSAAAMAASLPEDDQREIVDEINQGAKPAEAIKNHVLVTKFTGNEEWYTPSKYLDSARAVMGEINTDPASNPMAQETVNADTYFTIDDDGLTKHWWGKVWMNPPYTARVINRFIEKMVEHYQDGDVTEGIVLTNSNTDTSWFHHAANHAAAVCFTDGRINFIGRDGEKSNPTNGQSFIYFGSNIKAFKAEFDKHGLVMVKA